MKKIKKISKFIAIVVLLIIILYSALYLYNDSQKGLFEKINDLAVESVEDGDSPGIIIGIWGIGEKPWIRAYGFSNIATGNKMKPEMCFRIGSVTKTFVAAVILQLVNEGKINLDMPITSFKSLSVFPNGENITVKNLLKHTSGIYNYTYDETFNVKSEENLEYKWTFSSIIDIAARQKPVFDVGIKQEYSNTNYFMLGKIIEDVTENQLENEIYKRILKPFNLNKTYFPVNCKMEELYSSGYEYTSNGIKDMTEISPSGSWAAGGMVSNIYDLKKWAAILNEKGKLFDSELYAKQREIIPYNKNFQYGLGIMKYKDYWGHPGSITGYSCIVMYNPQKQITVIVMQNTELPPGLDLSFKVVDLVIKYTEED